LEELEILLYAGVLVNGRDVASHTPPVHVVKMTGQRINFVRWLVEKGADINAIDYIGRSVLSWAVAAYLLCHLPLIAETGMFTMKLLIQHGASVHSRDDAGKNVLEYASSCPGGSEVVELLLQKGTDPNSTFLTRFCSTNHQLGTMAACLDHTEFLLGNGAAVNHLNNNSRTLLSYAMEYGELDLARVLVKCGADVNTVNESGQPSALAKVVSNFDPPTKTIERVRLFIRHSAIINHKDDKCQTPMDLFLQRQKRVKKSKKKSKKEQKSFVLLGFLKCC
ncbi:ankyrin repeat-containing domain protein, partial [Triangularia setosa]